MPGQIYCWGLLPSFVFLFFPSTGPQPTAEVILAWINRDGECDTLGAWSSPAEWGEGKVISMTLKESRRKYPKSPKPHFHLWLSKLCVVWESISHKIRTKTDPKICFPSSTEDWNDFRSICSAAFASSQLAFALRMKLYTLRCELFKHWNTVRTHET